MKLRLFLFLFLACTLVTGSAMAQGCSTSPIAFPAPGGNDKTVASGTCIANVDAGSTGQGGRLRWNDSNNHELVLFDSDDGGGFLWCAGGGGNANNCAVGTILCLQQDGNMVMYTPRPGQGTIHCGNDGDGGLAVWASNTQHDNDGQEELVIEEDVVWMGVLRTGDRAVIRNGNGIQWASTGYTD